ncbi:uncharacterized protein LOC117787032 isoform X2 [Drosophila innubila]|uniref:uncharacterized protein LOC117787032 isoform X2 n=1 Tax=Drosophila innubila TaxID=198719 RepID=UPI00148D4FBD|nr:uncharacterized protein LOC117787032 isoform X2 [Drosophila innubila]
MYRTNGDSNNNMSHSIRRAYGPQPPQLYLESTSSVEEQCMRDDRYFNLLYKTYDNSDHGITQRINNFGSTGHFNANRSTLNLQRNETDKAWRSSLLDYTQMDAELSRSKQSIQHMDPKRSEVLILSTLVQRDCEAIENNLARVEIAAQNVPDDTSQDLNLVGSAFTTTGHSPSHAPGAGPDWNLNSRSTTLSTNLRQRCHHSPAITEIPSTYQLPTVAELVRDSNTEVVPSLPTEPQNFQQEVRKQLESISVPVSGSNTEPYRCPVCWNCVRQRKPASTLCGHVFCSSCIKTALRTTCKCPVCQRLMTTRQILRIYI